MKLWTYLKSLPVWLRAVLLALLAGVLLCLSLSSCGTTSRIIIEETSAGVSVSTTQSSDRQNSTSIEVNPVINYSK